MARFATISEIESTEIVICRLKSIITEYYFREILKRERDLKKETLQRDFEERFEGRLYKLYEERNFTSYTERDLKREI